MKLNDKVQQYLYAIKTELFIHTYLFFVLWNDNAVRWFSCVIKS